MGFEPSAAEELEQYKRAVAGARRRADQLADENADLRAAVERVRELHHVAAWATDGGLCVADRHEYPCPTARALDGDA